MSRTSGFAVMVSMKPISGLRLHGSGSRSARTPAPGALPREEPLLPRIETILGALANAYWSRRGGSGCSSWEECVLKPSLNLVCGGNWQQASIYGPFLLVIDRLGGNVKVYVNISSGLLEASNTAIQRYIEAAQAVFTPKYLPREILKTRQTVAEIFKELENRGSFIRREKLVKRLVGVALKPGAKAAEHGLLYSQAWIDLRKVGKGYAEHLITLYIYCKGNTAHVLDEEWVAALGPRSTPVQLRLTSIDTLSQTSTTEHSLVISYQPLDNTSIREVRAIHPARPAPSLELHASVYASHAPHSSPRKTLPMPALWPGTVILERRYIELLNSLNTYTANQDSIATLHRTVDLATLQHITEKLVSTYKPNS